MSHQDYKAAKEAFFSGLDGAPKQEVFALVLTISLTIVTCENLKPKRPRNPLLRLSLELLLIVYPYLLVSTGAIPAGVSFLLTLLLALGSTLLLLRWPPTATTAISCHQRAARLEAFCGRRKTFISVFRGALMAATAAAILAVDFPVFPRRYAKTETYGTGFMDVGVGGVLFASGLVAAPLAKDDTVQQHSEEIRSAGGDVGTSSTLRRRRRRPLWRRAVGALRAAAACWALGCVRLLTTRAVDYQVPVGEYGVHWNFFHTIAMVGLLVRVVDLPPDAAAPAALALTVGHQMVLSLGGLGPWALSPHRSSDLISANKEGLVSLTGFWALYLGGVALAHHMHVTLAPAVRYLKYGSAVQRRRPPVEATAAAADGGGPLAVEAPHGSLAMSGTTNQGDGARKGGGGDSNGDGGGGGVGGKLDDRAASGVAVVGPLVRWWLGLVAVDVALWAAVAVLETRVERVSRRCCNAPYIVWIAAQCFAGVLPLAAAQAVHTVVTATTTTTASGVVMGGFGNIHAECRPESKADSAGGEALAAADKDYSSGGGGGDGRGMGMRSNWVGLGGGGSGDQLDASLGGGKSGECMGVPSGGGSYAADAEDTAGWGPRLLLAINRNQLAFFLIANLATGAVNLTINTLEVPDWPARTVLAAYMTSLCAAALLMDRWRLQLRL